MQSAIEDPAKSACRAPGQQGEITTSSRLPPISGSGMFGTGIASDEKKHPAENIPSFTRGNSSGPSIATPNVDNGPSKSVDEANSGLESESVSNTENEYDHCWSWLSNRQDEDIFSRLLRKRGFEDESDDDANVEAKVNKRAKPSPLGENLPLNLSSPLNLDFDTGIQNSYSSFDDWLKYWESDFNKSEEIVDDLSSQVLCQDNDSTTAFNSVHPFLFDRDERKTPIDTVAGRISADGLYTHDCGKPQKDEVHFDTESDYRAREMTRDEILEAPLTAHRVQSNKFQELIEEVLPMQEHTPLPVPDQDLGVNPAEVHVPRAFRTPPPAQTRRKRAPATARLTSRRRAAPAAAAAPASLPAHATSVAPAPTSAPIPATTSAPLIHPTPVPSAGAALSHGSTPVHAPAQVAVASISASVVAVPQLPIFGISPPGRVAGKNENARATGKLPSWAKEVLYTNAASDLTQWIGGREAVLQQPNAVGMTTAEEQWVLSELYGPAREDLTPQQKRVSAEKRACEALPDSQKPILLDGPNEVQSFTNKDRDFVLVCRASFTLEDRTFSYRTSVCGQSFSSHDIVLRHVKEQHLDGGRKKKSLASTSTTGPAAVAVSTSQKASSTLISSAISTPLSTSASSTAPSTSAGAVTEDLLPAQDESSQ
ncbi:hypothetical protein FRC17_010690 [Serendipita sp. 399]|nr:hypothetical protein FRC17_010690 [Serendipita sp. 399]